MKERADAQLEGATECWRDASVRQPRPDPSRRMPQHAALCTDGNRMMAAKDSSQLFLAGVV